MAIASKDVFLRKENIDLYDALLVEGNIFIGLYYFEILKTSIKKKVVFAFILIGILNFVYKLLHFSEIKIFDSLGFSFLSIGVVILFFAYCHQILNEINTEPLSLSFDFWVNLSFIIYYLGSFVIYLTYNHFTNILLTLVIAKKGRDILSPYEHILTNLWGVHNILLFISCFCIVFGLIWKTSSKKYY